MVFEIKDYTSLKNATERFCVYLTEQNVPAERVFDSRLVASELVGNVLRHAKSTATLKVEICGEFVDIRVISESPYAPPKESKKADVFAEHGRGLFLVESVSAERAVTKDGVLVRIKIR